MEKLNNNFKSIAQETNCDQQKNKETLNENLSIDFIDAVLDEYADVMEALS